MRGVRRTTTFEVVELRPVKTGNCDVCGKKCSRKEHFYQTISPFNKGADGTVKGHLEIMTELKAKAAEWQKLPPRHVKCGG